MSSRTFDRSDKKSIPVWAKTIVLLSFSAVIIYKLLTAQIDMQFDFPTFLSLILSIFSVSLATMFYFKATETSNSFYDNTYKFTQEMASLLIKIESGFGEKLTNLDNAYKGMRDRFDLLPSKMEIKETKNELQQEEKELKVLIKEKEKLINNLVKKAKLEVEEKDSFMKELNSKDEALSDARQEIAFLKRKLLKVDDKKTNRFSYENLPLNMINYLRETLISELGGVDQIKSNDDKLLKKRFRRLFFDLPTRFTNDLISNNLINEYGEITENGIKVLRMEAEKLE